MHQTARHVRMKLALEQASRTPLTKSNIRSLEVFRDSADNKQKQLPHSSSSHPRGISNERQHHFFCTKSIPMSISTEDKEGSDDFKAHPSLTVTMPLMRSGTTWVHVRWQELKRGVRPTDNSELRKQTPCALLILFVLFTKSRDQHFLFLRNSCGYTYDCCHDKNEYDIIG